MTPDVAVRDASERLPVISSARAQMLADVRAGFSHAQKELPPTWFYDAAGSRLFDEITRLPEYYLTRTERVLLERHSDSLTGDLRPSSLAELGAGSADKSRILIDAALRTRTAFTYIPIDVSTSALTAAAAALAREYRGLTVRPLVADIRDAAPLLADVPRPLLYAFLGSTIGNFTPTEAIALLVRMHRALFDGDRLLLGVDLVKKPAVIERAYNDSRGVTARFNLNVLVVLNRELGADFDPRAFTHRAFYDASMKRVEMHLVATRAMQVRVPGAGTFHFEEGETIRTEISCKYERSDVDRMLEAAGFALERWITDERQWFALAVGAPRQPAPPPAEGTAQR